VSAKDKLTQVFADVAAKGANSLILSKLDDIAWILNTRGSDIECNPVTLAYLIVEKDSATLYIDQDKVSSSDVIDHLNQAGVTTKDYKEIISGVNSLLDGIMFDPATTSIAVADAARKFATIETASPVDLKKAKKNEKEIQGMREAHLRDAAALTKFFSWMDIATRKGENISEYTAGAELENFRAMEEGFVEPSFPTIAGEGPNGAIIHYRADKDTARDIKAGSLLLLDSGGQYDCGTTDVTRVYHFGGDAHQPTDFQKEAYTRVLKGHIALDTAVFPEGTPGHVLDAYARRYLWEAGLNYLHGTGHGVGAALNVHEGPQSISPRFTNPTPLSAGMVCSNEPGYYEDNSFGIRIENLLAVTPKESNEFNGVKYMGFERLTYVPIQIKMMKLELLTDEEIEWINDYHSEVWEKVSGRVGDEQIAQNWLFDNTQPIERPAASA